MAERIAVYLRLTPEAHEAIQRACDAGGVSMTALFEAVGRELHRHPNALGERGPDILREAQAIDLERRRRR